MFPDIYDEQWRRALDSEVVVVFGLDHKQLISQVVVNQHSPAGIRDVFGGR